MRRLPLLMIGVIALTGAGLVRAQPAPPPLELPPTPDTPPAPSGPPVEEPPPAPGEVGPGVVTTPPLSSLPTIRATPPEADETAEPEVEEERAPPPPPEPEPTLERPRHRAAVIQALDKITAETMRFEARVGVPVRYKGLVFTLRACETSASNETPRDAMAYLEVRAEPRVMTEKTPSRQVFRGWMYASSPGLNAFEHPVYDAWLIDCKASAPATAGPAAKKSPSTPRAPASKAR